MSVAADIDILSEVEVTPPQLCQEKRAALLLFWHKMSLFLPESLDFSKRTFLKSRNPASQDDSSKWTVEIKYHNITNLSYNIYIYVIYIYIYIYIYVCYSYIVIKNIIIYRNHMKSSFQCPLNSTFSSFRNARCQEPVQSAQPARCHAKP